ncbi:hypothetical protein niasHT_005928 [Heterodera trifolii]|uniref:Uncharacterized protein n=1 Tax=Heterodera trifolii TaxID=157864 RepID=A0ABD2LVZ0_9BILA
MCRFLHFHVSDLKNLSLNYSARLELLEKLQQSKQHEQLANRVLDKGNTELAVVQVAVSSLKRAMTPSLNTDQTSSSSSSSSSLKEED